AHLRYLIYADLPERSLVACLQFSSAAWRIAVRDEWIGWDDEARVRNLGHVVNNSRFLVLPWVEIKNLASRILGQAAGRIVVDWKRHYGLEPLLAETLEDPQRYRGTCYRAANWMDLGRTSGLRESDLERELEKRGRELMRQLLEAHVEVRGPGEAAAPVKGSDGEELVQQRLHERGLETVFGEVRIERAGYLAEGKTGLHPM